MNTKDWEALASKQLLGKTIVKVRYMTDQEVEDLGWYSKALVLHLDDGNIIYPSADDEGNNAGALFTNNPEDDVFPVI